MILPISEKYIDANKYYSDIEEFIFDSGISVEVLQFATDMYGLDQGILDVINYYDIEQEFDDYFLDLIEN